MQKIIKIDGKKVKIVANALIPRQYRFHFGRDIISDMMQLEKALKKHKEEGTNFNAIDLTIFENVAWLFLKAGGEDVGSSPDEWLEGLDGMFSVYEALPEMLSLWRANLATKSTPKKKIR